MEMVLHLYLTLYLTLSNITFKKCKVRDSKITCIKNERKNDFLYYYLNLMDK